MKDRPNDKDVILRYLAGDESAFEELLRMHADSIYSYAFRISNSEGMASDITQESFIKAWKSFKKYDTQKSFRTWILSITHNTAIDWLRKRKNLNFTDMNALGTDDDPDFASQIPDEEPLPDEIAESQESKKILLLGIAELSSRERSVITLHINENMTFDEISEIESTSINTVKSIYRRAILKLRKMLELHQNKAN